MLTEDSINLIVVCCLLAVALICITAGFITRNWWN